MPPWNEIRPDASPRFASAETASVPLCPAPNAVPPVYVLMPVSRVGVPVPAWTTVPVPEIEPE